jgi:hypothetical protein
MRAAICRDYEGLVFYEAKGKFARLSDERTESASKIRDDACGAIPTCRAPNQWSNTDVVGRSQFAAFGEADQVELRRVYASVGLLGVAREGRRDRAF